MNNKGFTLVEVLVSVLAISIALGGAFTAAQLSLRYSITSQNRVTAFYLAQEGFELIRNVRDSNFQDNTIHWIHGLDGVEGESDCIRNYCSISAFPFFDKTKREINICQPDDDSCILVLDDTSINAGIRYAHNDYSAPQGQFKRYFKIEETQVDEIKVDMTIAWTQGSNDYTFETTEYISNWRGDHTDPL